MPTTATDKQRRATFGRINPRSDVRPTDREVRWLKQLERHGPQSSELLYELTRDTHRCKDTSLRDLQKLRAGGFLRLPVQQRQAERAAFNPYIYDLTKQAEDHLKGLGLAERTVRPRGHWWHAYATAAFTGSLDILAERDGREFIPAHKILQRVNAELPIPIGRKTLIPDQLFAVHYPDGYRAFLLEVDRGTEPLTSARARKSLASAIDLYTKMFATNAHQQHYGLNATTLCLWVFTSPARMAQFFELVDGRAGAARPFFLAKVMHPQISWAALRMLHGRPWIGLDEREVVGL